MKETYMHKTQLH